jgi:2-polyprenyl-3-methyl-5-hydroxy-6-metoxy-1,4-benzoquinol methylase
METPSSQTSDYAFRLARIEAAPYRKWIDVQAPYRYNLQRLHLGFTLDIGAGIGRNLFHLKKEGVGVDPNQEAVRQMRERGLVAYTPTEFSTSPYAKTGRFDSLLIAHVLEHLSQKDRQSLLGQYLPFLKDGGKVVLITPQEAGYRSDVTHVEFVDAKAAAQLATEAGLQVEKTYSFPFPRWFGSIFRHNEFVVVAKK